jgi:hypothetical protein
MSKNQVQSVLGQGLSLIAKRRLNGLYDLLEEDSRFAAKFASAISKTYKVHTFLEIDEIAGYYDDVLKRNNPTNASGWEEAFKDNYLLNVVDCYSIAPLDTPVLFSLSSAIKRRTALLDFLITPVLRDTKSLFAYLKRNIPGFKCNSELLDHFVKKSNDALTQRNLLIIKSKGTYQRVSKTTERQLRAFRTTAELITAYKKARNHIGSYCDNTLVLEYRPKYKSFQYNWTDSVARLAFSISSDLLNAIRSEKAIHVYSYLISWNGHKKLRSRLTKATDLFTKGYNAKEHLERFIFYIIALECLFSRDKGTPIRTTLADYVAVLVSKPADRLATHKRMKKIYDIRSELFHTGNYFIAESIVKELELLLCRTIFALMEDIRIKPEITEDQIFDDLIRRKLGIK